MHKSCVVWVEKVVKYMRGRLAAFAIGRQAGKNAAQQPQQSVSDGTSTSELENLVDMHNKGALTDEEFAKAKKKLLSK